MARWKIKPTDKMRVHDHKPNMFRVKLGEYRIKHHSDDSFETRPIFLTYSGPCNDSSCKAGMNCVNREYALKMTFGCSNVGIHWIASRVQPRIFKSTGLFIPIIIKYYRNNFTCQLGYRWRGGHSIPPRTSWTRYSYAEVGATTKLSDIEEQIGIIIRNLNKKKRVFKLKKDVDQKIDALLGKIKVMDMMAKM